MNNVNQYSKSIAITGMGCLFPKADSIQSYWANIKEGVDAIREIPSTHWNPDDFFDLDPNTPDHVNGKMGGFIDPVEFNPLAFGIAPNTLEATDTAQLLTLLAVEQALKDAGYHNGKPVDRDRVSIILGVTGAQELVIPLGARLSHPIWRKALADCGIDGTMAEEICRRIAHGYVDWQEASFPGLLGNVVAGRVANKFDFGGTNCAVDAACAGSLSAIHMACMELQSGHSDMAISGGVDTFNNIFMYMCFSKTKALSPSGHARPFDITSDGTTLAEGLGVVVLKRLEDAERDNDKIYCVIKGIGTSSDGKGQAIYAPSAEGQKKALRTAYSISGVTPESIELVEAHGTGTKVGDAIEVSALNEIYTAAKTPISHCALGSVKSQMGHAKAAAGIAGIIKTALALNKKVLPPTIKVDQPMPQLNPGASPFYVNTVKRPWPASEGHPRRAAVSSFGFGGANFHCVLEEYSRNNSAQPDYDGNTAILAFFASDREGLIRKLTSLHRPDEWLEILKLSASQLAQSAPETGCRLFIVLQKDGNHREQLETAQRLLTNQPDAATWSSPKGIYFGSGKPAGSLAMIFPGQGIQYPGMLRDLACTFPCFGTVLDDANKNFGTDTTATGNRRLSDYIYPIPVFSEADKNSQIDELKNTRVAQPAIGATSLASLKILELFGIKPAMAAGHSYGEITALCAAGVLSESDFHALSKLRGQLMSSGDTDRGTMAAVQAPLEDIEKVIREENLDVVIANRNAPKQGVISGPTPAIQNAVKIFKARKMRIVPLPVSAAFHHPLVEDATQPFSNALDSITFHESRFPVFSNTTGQRYPSDISEMKTLLAGQLEKPVYFVDEIRNIYAAGARTFLEAGPGGRMTGLIKNILGDVPFQAFALDASAGKKPGMFDLACTLSHLAALGHSVDLSEFNSTLSFPAPEKSGKPLMTVTLTGSNYRKPVKPLPPVTFKPAVTAAAPPIAAPDQRQQSVPVSTGAAPVQPPPVVQATPEAMKMVQSSFMTLQRIQEQTAELHRTFLENQKEAQVAFKALIQQQQALLSGVPGMTVTETVSAASETSVPTVPVPSTSPVQSVAPSAEIPSPASIPVREQAPVSQVDATVLLGIVAEKTGYPADILNLDMELDSDLGIDSIKRVEILSALQEAMPHLPMVTPDEMATIRTLRDIADKLTAGTVPPDGKPDAPAPLPASQVDATVLLEIVAEKTGYPADILNLDMELDSDLGIDSIKRVEILSALQEAMPHLPMVTPDEMATIRTLRDIADKLTAGTVPPDGKPDASAPLPASQVDATVLLEIVAEKTGYPVDILNLDMELDSDLGIDSIKRVEILSALQEAMPHLPMVTPDEMATIRTLQDIADKLNADAVPPAVEPDGPEDLPAQVESTISPVEPVTPPVNHDYRQDLIKQIPVMKTMTAPDLSAIKAFQNSHPNGVIWIADSGSETGIQIDSYLSGLGLQIRRQNAAALSQEVCPESLTGLIIIPELEQVDSAYYIHVLKLMQAARNPLQATPDSFLCSITALDGAFGLENEFPEDRENHAGVHGMVKSAAFEWPQVTCRCLDLASDDTFHPEASRIMAWILAGTIREIGLTESKDRAVILADADFPDSDTGTPPIAPGETVIVTGGARGVTAETAVALARRFKPHLVLLGRSPLPQPEPQWLCSAQSPQEIQSAIINQQGKLSPRDLRDQVSTVMKNREILDTLQRIQTAGATVEYHSVDITREIEVSDYFHTLQQPVTGIVHGAGVLADKLIQDKTADDFEPVFKTKVAGLNHLLKYVNRDLLKCLILFSSSTARFGRKGQSDYAAANEILNKTAQCIARQYPQCRTLSFNWGPWDGGMVTPSLKALFESEGVGIIPLVGGAEYLVDEMSQDQNTVEVVILGTPPVLPESQETEEAAVPDQITLEPAFQQDVNLRTHPVLNDHRIDGKPVVPLALMMEWAAAAALHQNPGLTFFGLDNFRVTKGIILEEYRGRTVHVMTGKTAANGSVFRMPVQIVSSNGNGANLTHVTGEAVLTASSQTPPDWTPPPMESSIIPPRKIYTSDLFHGPMLQGITRINAMDQTGFQIETAPAPNVKLWIADPFRNRWITHPMATDCAFQMMIIWCLNNLDLPSLPVYFKQFRQFGKWSPQSVQITAEITKARSRLARANFTFKSGSQIAATMQGFECITDKSLKDSFQKSRELQRAY